MAVPWKIPKVKCANFLVRASHVLSVTYCAALQIDLRSRLNSLSRKQLRILCLEWTTWNSQCAGDCRRNWQRATSYRRSTRSGRKTLEQARKFISQNAHGSPCQPCPLGYIGPVLMRKGFGTSVVNGPQQGLFVRF